MRNSEQTYELESCSFVSLKTGFFITDSSEQDCENFSVVYPSHSQNELAFPADEASNSEGILVVRVARGGAVFCDFRFWNSASPITHGSIAI